MEESSSERAVALLIALAAIVGVALGARATTLADGASSAWQSSVRLEVKRAAATVEDVRFVYVDEAPVAMKGAAARIRAAELERAVAAAPRNARTRLILEAQALRTFAEQVPKSAPSLKEYGTRQGGFDAAKRLADVRRRYPDLVALDPDGKQREGDRLGRRAVLEALATVPAAIGFLLGALAEAFHRRRRPLVLAGSVFVAGALVLGLVLELL